MLQLLAEHVAIPLQKALFGVLLPLPFFILLAAAVKRRRLIADTAGAAAESRFNLLLGFFDAVIVLPVVIAAAASARFCIERFGIPAVPAEAWSGLPPLAAAFAAVFVGDFIGYWRHRFEHTRALWPSHAIHHSDGEMTWLAIQRFHPVNRLTTVVIDGTALSLLGLPPFAIGINAFVRHYYGAYIHADLPWTYGPLGRIFVSPAMHRWHHSIEPEAYGTNFATVFSVFDQAFGTYRVPGPCRTELGVTGLTGRNLLLQLCHPLRPAAYRTTSDKQRDLGEPDIGAPEDASDLAAPLTGSPALSAART